MATGTKSYTAAGNVRAPSKALCLEWVRECWEELPTEIIKKSFQACGISVEIDGTHNGEIHCLKPGGVAADARGAINTETANLLAGVSEDDDEDPFAGLEEDEDELEENETVLDDC